MPYQIKCDDLVLYDPRDEDLVVLNPRCRLAVNTVGEASFTILSGHQHYDKLSKLRSVFEIIQDNEVIFRGRMTDDSKDFHNRKQVDLEGAMAYFNDSMVRPFKFPDDFLENFHYQEAYQSGNVVEFFLKHIIDSHNSQVEQFQRFKLGRVTVSDPNNYIKREESSYTKSWEILKEKLFESSLGGYLCIRYEPDGNYIDYLEKFDSDNTQKIVFGENLLDLLVESDATETYSAIIPLGAEAEMKAGEDYSGDYVDIENTEMRKLTLEDLPDGNITDDIVKKGDTLYSKSAVAEYGWIYAPVDETTWDDVETAEALQTKGVDFIKNKSARLWETVTAKAIDLHLSDSEIESFRIYKNVYVESKPHNQSGKNKFSEIEIDIENPQNTKFTVGETKRVLTDKTNTASRRVSLVQNTVSKYSVDLSKKVDKTDKKQVVKMINEASDKITLTNRLVVDSEKFGMDEDGAIHASGGDIAGFEFDTDGLKKNTAEYNDDFTVLTRKKFEVAPGHLLAEENNMTAAIPTSIKRTEISDGALKITRNDLISEMFGQNLSFATVTINGTTYNLFIDPDNLSIKVTIQV